MFLLSVVASLFVNPRKKYGKQSRFYRFLLNSTATEVFAVCRTRFHVTGMEIVPKDTPFLLVSNHRSNFDPICTWHILGKSDVSFISKESNFHIPWYGKIIRRCCFLDIDRKNPRKAMETVRRAADLLKRGEVNIGVYPEGTRHRDGEMGEFHALTLRAAIEAKVPIVVMSISGAEKISRLFPWRGADVFIDFLDVYAAEEVATARCAVLSERARQRIKNHLDGEDGHPDVIEEAAAL